MMNWHGRIFGRTHLRRWSVVGSGDPWPHQVPQPQLQQRPAGPRMAPPPPGPAYNHEVHMDGFLPRFVQLPSGAVPLHLRDGEHVQFCTRASSRNLCAGLYQQAPAAHAPVAVASYSQEGASSYGQDRAAAVSSSSPPSAAPWPSTAPPHVFWYTTWAKF